MQITGWRAWAVVEDGEGFALASPAQGSLWPASRLDAVCRHGDIATCPGQCGIRIWHERSSAEIEAKHASASIIGEAHAYGYITEYEKAHLASICVIGDLDFDSLQGIGENQRESVVSALKKRYS